MHPVPKNIYLTPDEIDVRIAEREAQARPLAAGQTRQQLQAEIARLRIYAAMKRLLTVRSWLRQQNRRRTLMSEQNTSRVWEWIVPPIVVPSLIAVAILVAAWSA
jgi:hypothetical protein